MKIYLLGFMGSGKSSFGKRLARKLDYAFVDIDQKVEEMAGMAVTGIFEKMGVNAFRRMEKEALLSTAGQTKLVVATGGGTPCHFSNMDFILENGVAVYLKMSPLSLAHRLEHAQKARPLVQDRKGEELLAWIREKLAEREPVYSRAHCIIKGETVKPDQVIALVFGS